MAEKDPDEFEEKTTATIAEAFDVMVEASGIVHRNASFLSRVSGELSKVIRPLIWIVGVTFLVSLILVGQLIFRDSRLEQLETQISILDKDVKAMQDAADDAKDAAVDAERASAEARTASEGAKVALEEALAQSQRGGVSPQVIEALDRINVIYEACRARGECR